MAHRVPHYVRSRGVDKVEYGRVRRARAKELELCPRCWEDAAPPFVYCPNCRASAAEDFRRYYYARKQGA